MGLRSAIPVPAFLTDNATPENSTPTLRSGRFIVLGLLQHLQDGGFLDFAEVFFETDLPGVQRAGHGWDGGSAGGPVGYWIPVFPWVFL
jgi:hypothetical protein